MEVIGFHADINSLITIKNKKNYTIELIAVSKSICPLDCIKTKQINVSALLCLPCSFMSPKSYIGHHHIICMCDDGYISLDHAVHMIQRHVFHEYGKKHLLSA